MKLKNEETAVPDKQTAVENKVIPNSDATPASPDPSTKKRVDTANPSRASIPSKYRKLYGRAVAGTASPREAIKSFCLQCTGWSVNEVRNCTSPECPLYAYRPYQKSPEVLDSATLAVKNRITASGETVRPCHA